MFQESAPIKCIWAPPPRDFPTQWNFITVRAPSTAKNLQWIKPHIKISSFIERLWLNNSQPFHCTFHLSLSSPQMKEHPWAAASFTTLQASTLTMHKSKKSKNKKPCKVYLLTVQPELTNLPYSTKIDQEFGRTYGKPIILWLWNEIKMLEAEELRPELKTKYLIQMERSIYTNRGGELWGQVMLKI